jgi:protein-tyrosine phosphatase
MGEHPAFVDCHSHMVPSGDDGVSSTAEGLELCRAAARRGTAVLFATPHVLPHLTLTREREAAVRAAYEAMRPQAELELRLGFELTPDRRLLAEDPARYELEGTGCVLMEVPFIGSADLFFRVADHIEGEGFQVVVAHPERTESVLSDPGLAGELAGRGWLLQVNSTSMLGRHGDDIEELAWRLLEEGTAAIVASDGHRATRPPYLDEAYAAAVELLGERAVSFFDGSALGVSPRRTPSPAASTSA